MRPFPTTSILPSAFPWAGLTETPFTLNLLPLELRKKVREYGKPDLLDPRLPGGRSLGWPGAAGCTTGTESELETLRAEVKKKKPEVEAVEKIQKQRTEMTARDRGI